MNGNNFENMVKKYADELVKMSKEKMLPDIPEEESDRSTADIPEQKEESDFLPFEQEQEKETAVRTTPADIPGIENTDFYEQTAEESLSDEETADENADYAVFSARVFTGNNAYPIKNAKVLVIKNDTLYTFLTTDRDGVTKKIRLPSFPESNSLNPYSNMQTVQYTGEVYATGFTPKKNLLIGAVGGSDIILDVQMTPISAEVK